MRSHIFYKIVVISVLTAVFSCSGYCQTEFPLKPILNYVNGVTNTGSGVMEMGIKFDTTSCGFLKFGARVPLLKNDKNTSQIDKNTDNFNFFIGNEINKDHLDSKRNIISSISIEPLVEWGRMKFTYYPDTSKISEISDWKNNWAAEIKGRYYFSRMKEGAWQWSIYGRLRYSQSYTASDAIHVLNPTTTLVNDFIVSSAQRTKMIAPSAGFQLYPGTNIPVSFSPIVYYYWIDKDNINGFEKERLRTEEWIYFYPIDKKYLGLRVGFGAFQDHYTKGQSKNRSIAGGLVGIKMDTDILKSIF
jgi:hypothetical protein